MNIKRLAILIRKSHRQTKSWNKTGREFEITGGMAFRIAHSNYEPANEAIREKLGLDVKTCPRCGHRHFNRIKKDKPDWMKTWDHLPKDERHKAIRQYLEWRKNAKTSDSKSKEV